MRIVFFGSGNFAVPILESLLSENCEVAAVVTQPDREAGRYLKITPTPVKEYAERKNISVFCPQNLSCEDSIKRIKQINADLFIVVQYGLMIPKEILEAPKIFSVNVHASLLPKYRGAAPINWAIINGEKETGISVIKMNEFMDKGDVILQKSTLIKDNDDALSLSVRLSDLAVKCVLETLVLIKNNKCMLIKQDDNIASYARKLIKQDGLIDWHAASRDIFNRVRGLLPWPVAYTHFGAKMLKIWKAECLEGVCDDSHKSGQVLDVTPGSVVVSCLGSALAIKEVQLESSKRMPAYDFAVGHKIKKGDFVGL